MLMAGFNLVAVVGSERFLRQIQSTSIQLRRGLLRAFFGWPSNSETNEWLRINGTDYRLKSSFIAK